MNNQIRKMLTQGRFSRERKSCNEDSPRWLTEAQEKDHTLQEENDLLSRFSDAIPDVLFLYDTATRGCVYVNKQLASALGFTDREISGMGSTLFENLLCPEDLRLFADEIEKLRTFQDDDIHETEYRLRHADGEWRWFHFRAAVFTRNCGGLPDLILYVARDITDQRKYEEALRQGEVLMALGRMSRQIAQEINTPLANIKNSLFLLRKAILPDHPDAKYLRWSEEEVDRIAETVRQISLRSRLDS